MSGRSTPRPPRREAPAQPARPSWLRADGALPCAGIFALALVLRLIHLWQIRQAPFFDLLIGDARAYDLWAQQIAAGDWIGREVFYQAPLYAYFLGLVYSIAGDRAKVQRMSHFGVDLADISL